MGTPGYTLPAAPGQVLQAAGPAKVVGALLPTVMPQVLSAVPASSSTKRPLPFTLPVSCPISNASSRSTGGGPARNPNYKKNSDHFSLRMNNIPHGVSSNELWEAFEFKGIHTITDCYI